MLAAVVLTFEALVIVFAGLVARGLSGLPPGTALGLSGALALACLLAAGVQRGPAGHAIGSALQVAVVASGFWVGTMFVLGPLFGALWVVALRVGRRIDREKAADAARAPAAPPAASV